MDYSSLFDSDWLKDTATSSSNCNAYGDAEDGLGEYGDGLLNSYLKLASDDSDEENESISRSFMHQLPPSDMNFHTITEENENSQPASPSTLAFHSLAIGSRIPQLTHSLPASPFRTYFAQSTVNEITQEINKLLSISLTQTSLSYEGPVHLPLGVEIAIEEFHRGEYSTSKLDDDDLVPNPLRHIIPPLISSYEEEYYSSDDESLHSDTYSRRYDELEEQTDFHTFDESDDVHYVESSFEARYFRTDPGLPETFGDCRSMIQQTHLSTLHEIQSQTGSLYLPSPLPSPQYVPFHKDLPALPSLGSQASDQGYGRPDLQKSHQASKSFSPADPVKTTAIATRRLQEYIETRDRAVASRKQEQKQASPPILGRLDNLRISELFGDAPAYKGDDIHPIRRSSNLPRSLQVDTDFRQQRPSIESSSTLPRLLQIGQDSQQKRPSVEIIDQASTPPSSPPQLHFSAGTCSSTGSSDRTCASSSHPILTHHKEGQVGSGVYENDDLLDAFVPQAHLMPVNGQMRRRPSFESRIQYAKATEGLNGLQRLIELNPYAPAKMVEDEYVVETDSFPMKAKRSMLMRESVYQRKRPHKRSREPRRSATGIGHDHLSAFNDVPKRAASNPIVEDPRESSYAAPMAQLSNSFPPRQYDVLYYPARQKTHSDPYPARQQTVPEPPSPRHVSFDLDAKPQHTLTSRTSKFFGIADSPKLGSRGGSSDNSRLFKVKRPSFSKRRPSVEQLLKDGKHGVKGLIGNIRKSVLSEENG